MTLSPVHLPMNLSIASFPSNSASTYPLDFHSYMIKCGIDRLKESFTLKASIKFTF